MIHYLSVLLILSQTSSSRKTEKLSMLHSYSIPRYLCTAASWALQTRAWISAPVKPVIPSPSKSSEFVSGESWRFTWAPRWDRISIRSSYEINAYTITTSNTMMHILVGYKLYWVDRRRDAYLIGRVGGRLDL